MNGPIRCAVCLQLAAACTHATKPTHEWTVPAGEVTLHAVAFGGGERARTVIVVGGGPGVSHDYTRGLAALASPELRVLFYDQRGTGRSTAPKADRWDLTAYVEDLEALRAAVGLERPHVLGHSWGGMVALAYAERHPDRVASLMLVDSGAPSSAGLDTMERHFEERLSALTREGLLSGPRPEPAGDDCMPVVRWLNPAYFADPRNPAGKESVGTCSARAQDRTFEALGKYDLHPEAARVTAPVLIVHGEKDPFGLEVVDELAAALPRAERLVLPGCGHIPWHEAPERFFGAARAFLMR